MNNKSPLPRGFSLLEVLIAIAILAFGLLAITSLQASLVRSSSEAKARSTALSLAKDRIEQYRAFDSIDAYKDLTDEAEASVGTLGGVEYTVQTEVLRYAYDGTAKAFELLASDTAEPAAEYVDENEFKRVKVTVGWFDVTGQKQTIVLQDAIGSVAPENTGKLARRSLPAAERRPEILITNPASDPGVIPIAIGDGSETAATNPRPEVATGVELQTSYDIFTYAALNNSTDARAQSRVETAVIGCTCDFGEKNTDQIAYRPIVWDGTRYVAPDPAGYTPIAGEARLNGKASQSVLCNACCRDHHDPTGTSAPLFSPRLETHAHYEDGDLTAPVTSGEYIEACRMIRVDGIFRVAADPYNEYTNLLKTAIKSGETDYFTDFRPDEAAADDYVDFVIDYLENQMAQSDPNAQIAQADADALAETAGLNDPAEVIETGNKRWAHARGLYIDYLEQDAKEAIDESAGCSDTLSDSECLLRVLPFTSINVTELATWRPKAGESSAIVVENNLFRESINFDEPVRGQVTGLAIGSANATAIIRTSNTGLLAQDSYVISPYDLTDTDPDAIPDQPDNIDDQPDADEQTFTIEGPECGVVATPSTITGGEVKTYATAATCEAVDTSRPLPKIMLTLNPVAGPSTVMIELIAPDGKVYIVEPAGTSFDALKTSYEIQAVSAASGGVFTLRVTSNDNGNKAETITIGFNVEYRYTATFTLGLSGYTFTTLTQPSGAVSTGGTCSFSNSVNPTTCATTQPGVSTTITLGTYNYTGTLANQSVVCKKSNGSDLSCPGVTATTCRNFNVESATNQPAGGGAAITAQPGTVGNPGKIAESTPLTFSSVGSGDVITVVMTETTPAAIATCAAQSCNNITWTCP